MSEITVPQVQSIEILNDQGYGYGPNGSMKRGDWRKECVVRLYSGATKFKAWQQDVIARHTRTEEASFGLKLNGNPKQSLATNSCTLDFEGCLFEADFYSSGIEFLLPCSFNYAVFKSNAFFIDSIFKDSVWFNSVKFNQFAWFENAVFCKLASFSDAEFYAQNSFGRATFEKGCLFNCAVFKSVGNFVDAHFNAVPPNFRGADIATTRLEFSDDRYFPKVHADGSDWYEVVKDIGFLKRLSDEHGQADQALNFNAMELRAKRLLPDVSWQFKVVTWLYEVVSDFGRSFTQPLKIFIYLFLVTFVGALIFAGKSAPIICTERMLQYDGDIQSRSPVSCLSYYQTTDEFKLSGYRAAFEYASYRSSGILDFSDNDKQTSAINMRVFDQKVEPTWVRVYGIFKAIASTALLFLAALGLRNKYRIK
jgi:hypothetical protein